MNLVDDSMESYSIFNNNCPYSVAHTDSLCCMHQSFTKTCHATSLLDLILYQPQQSKTEMQEYPKQLSCYNLSHKW